MVNGVVYSTAVATRVVALDAATGELLWTHSERRRGDNARVACRAAVWRIGDGRAGANEFFM
jgi:glucose dehydrogenase